MNWKIVLLLPLVAALNASALQARDLIKEAEEVLGELKDTDPEKRPVSLRLADLLFDAALELDADATSGDAERAEADQYRDRAQSLYSAALPHLSSAAKLRVQFQLARLHTFKAEVMEANSLWRQIFETEGDARLRREAALHWAEQLEQDNDPKSIRQAADLYEKSLPLADRDSLRAYILYRHSWARYRLGESDRAVDLVLKGIPLAHKKEREDFFRDLILFMSRQRRPAAEQVALLEKLQKDFDREKLVDQLIEGYLSVDRKLDYVWAMQHLNKRSPTLERTIAMLDAAHDGLSGEQVSSHLAEIRGAYDQGLRFKTPESETKSKNQLFRLVHLWDGNRRAKKVGADELFTDGVNTMTLIFTSADETKKSIEGWLAAHDDLSRRRAQVDHWLALATKSFYKPLVVQLVQNKIELARRAKDWTVVVAETKHLEELTAAQERPVRYQQAKALYELKQYKEALPIFVSLAEEDSKAKDDLQKLSQDLVLDILAIQKDYPRIQFYTAKWQPTGERGDELKSIGEKAKFEQAVAEQSAASLTVFKDFCIAEKFKPQSCDNAKSLALKLKEQGTLIAVLKADGQDDELAKQLEVAGRFAESARVLEKTWSPPDRMAGLKIALLFELQGDWSERDRVLKTLTDHWNKDAETPETEQALLFKTLSDAGLLTESSLELPWSEARKLKLASRLYDEKSSPVAEKILAKTCEVGGPGWERLHLKAMKSTFQEQAKINDFTGAKSKRNFEKRVALLKTLGEQTNCFKQSATPELARAATVKVASSYKGFAEQIRSTPVPEDLDEETLAQVKGQIETMASPFEKQGEKWQSQADDIVAADMPSEWDYEAAQVPASQKTALKFDWQPYLEQIQKTPFDKMQYASLKDHLERVGFDRLAAYVNGRMQDMGVQ
ncbi:MAG: tetratricopeptide repeat protein [Bdellovibrionales bacterium]